MPRRSFKRLERDRRRQYQGRQGYEMRARSPCACPDVLDLMDAARAGAGSARDLECRAHAESCPLCYRRMASYRAALNTGE